MAKEENGGPSDEVKRRVLNRGMVFLLEDVLGAYPNKTVMRMTEPYVPGTGGELEISFLADYLYADTVEKLYHMINREVADGKPSVDVNIHWIWDAERRKELRDQFAEDSEDGFVDYFAVDVVVRFSENDWKELVGE